MRKLVKLFVLITVLLNTSTSNGQIAPDSAFRGSSIGDFFDKIFDNSGKAYPLSSLKLPNASGAMPHNSSAKQSNVLACNSGYFTLWFEQDWDGIAPNKLSAADAATAQATICQVFRDLSNFIVRPPSATDNVQIWVRDITQMGVTTPSTSDTRGVASPFFYMPPFSSGIADNMVWLTINGGKDAMINVASPLINTSTAVGTAGSGSAISGGYFHGQFAINFSNPSRLWEYNSTTATVSGGKVDLYTVVFHEMLHFLGMATNFRENGLSVFNAPYQYFARYDLNLQTVAGAKLLNTPSSNCNPIYNNIFNSAVPLTAINSAGTVNSGPQVDVSVASPIQFASSNLPAPGNVPVYTPAAWEPGGSLSHLEDDIAQPSGSPGAPTGSNRYYVMSNGIVQNLHKRAPKEQERIILNNIGYQLNGNSYVTNFGLGSAVTTTYSTTTTSTPAIDAGIRTIGYCDGISSGAFTNTVNAGSTLSIAIASIIANDVNATGIACAEVLNSAGSTVSISAGNLVFTASSASSGIVLLRYVPTRLIGATTFFGNITYIYILINSNCPASPCNLVVNGGFENYSGNNCGSGGGTNCWLACNGSPDMVSNLSPCIPSFLQLPTSPFFSPGTNVWNPTSSNARALAIFGRGPSMPVAESAQTLLAANLIPGNTYTLRMKVNATTSFTNSNPCFMSVVGSSGTLAGPATYNIAGIGIVSLHSTLDNITLSKNAGWLNYSNSFLYNGAVSLNNLIVANNFGAVTVTTQDQCELLIDDVELINGIPSISFTPPSTNTCSNPITNLAQYLNALPTSGVTFTGPNNSVTQTAGQWNFNPALAGNGNAIITCTYTDANGCTVNVSANIMVSNIFSFTVNPSSCTLVAGTATLTAVGAPVGTTFVWKNSAGTTISTAATATITAAGNYTCTATNGGCALSVVYNYINANPTVTAVATGCLPSTAIVTATGNNTLAPVMYKLNTGTPQSSNVFAVTAAGTYTVTVLSANGVCSATTLVQVLPVFTVSATATTLPNCSGGLGTITASAAGATSFVWSTGATTSTCSITGAGVYTVTATSALGCTSVSFVSVTAGAVNPCAGGSGLGPSIPATVGANPAGWFIGANITISANTTFNGADIGIRAGQSITVASPAVLTISNSHLRACNGGFWKGIIVESGARLVINNNSLIEDAELAVKINATATTSNVLTINGAIFNKNSFGVYIDKCVAAITPTTYVITNSVFTSRLLPLTCTTTTLPNWPTVAALKVANPSLPNDLTSPFLSAAASPATAPLINGSAVSTIHIQLVGSGNTTGTSPFTYNSVTIGEGATATNFNLFDRAWYGVAAVNSNVALFNNVFQNIVPGQGGGGQAVYAYTTSLANTFTVKRYKLAASFTNASVVNKFFACNKGIIAQNYTTHDIQRCDMRSLQSSALINATTYANSNTVGLHGISLTSNNYDDTKVLNNKIFNHFNGISYICPIASGSSFGNALIKDNTVNRTNVSAIATAFCASAINVNTGYDAGAVPTAAVKTINVQSNILNGVYEGINISNFNTSNLATVVQQNNITLVADPNVVTAGITHFGIRSTNMGWTHSIIANTVRGINNTNSAQNSRVVNYEIVGNSNQTISCNRSFNGYTGFKFTGTMPSTVWRNSITNDATPAPGSSHWYILNLNNAAIGDQGSATNSFDNTFGNINGGVGSGHTNVIGVTACSSRIWHRSAVLPFRPSTNLGAGAVNYTTAFCTPTALSALTSVPALTTCTPPPPAPVASPGLPSASSIALMHAIINNAITYGADSVLQRWQAQFNLFRQLMADSAARNASGTITNFYNTTVPLSMKNLALSGSLLAQGNAISASSLLATIFPANIIETNYKNFYLAYMAYVNNTMTVQDKETIRLLALGCPEANGGIVFNARAMHNLLNPEQFSMYANNCPGSANKKPNEEEVLTAAVNTSYQLYPNPTANGFYIKQGSAAGANLTVELYDMTGKKVMSQSCTYTGQDCYFYTNLSDGNYVVRITNQATNVHETAKLLIVH
jgi:hypothetical protein